MTLGRILFFFSGLAVLSAQGTDPRVGSWHLNVAKSKYTPGPAPKSQTLNIEADEKGEKVTSESVSDSGAKTVTGVHRRLRRRAPSLDGLPPRRRHGDAETGSTRTRANGSTARTARPW